ncbi:MAG: ABC-F family ATP-binding cassette domain-containing protein [Clostridiales bacterium]|nr:ABC-F family ATP-binding cassette domain-containing protein [Clostridiales bacterium]
MNLLTINNLIKAYTDRQLFDHVDFGIDSGDKIGIIGVNGTGKSTLLKIISGLEESDTSDVIRGNKVHIGYLSQNPVFKKGSTILEHVISSTTTVHNQATIEGSAKAILNKLGFLDYEAQIDNLSGGQKKKVALAVALLTDCEILVLDEPTNHLDNDMTEWLQEYLNRYNGAIVMVTHDRYFLDLVCNRIVEIQNGKLYNYNSNYEGYLQLKSEREEMQLATARKHATILKKEIEWMQRGARARATKQKAHIARYEALRDEEKIKETEKIEISSLSSRLGKKTIEVEHLKKAYGEKELIKDYSYIFLRNDRIGIIGNNGCGKTTLLRMLNNLVEPDGGTIEIGDTVKIGYFSQENENMDDKKRVIDYIRETAEYIQIPEGTITASQMLERFLFEGALQYSVIGKLSGGEKRRLYLLKILMEAPNVLMLDEPTNDLDIQTLRILEDYLDEFQGIIITVSHDRYFLDRVVNRLMYFEGNGIIKQYEGNYTDFYMSKKSEEEKNELPKGSGNNTTKNQKVKTEKLKLTFQEKKDYESIEQEMEELEKKLKILDLEIQNASTNFVELNRLTIKKQETEQLLESKIERYLYLEELVSKIREAEENG